jgi:hypothetical protein
VPEFFREFVERVNRFVSILVMACPSFKRRSPLRVRKKTNQRYGLIRTASEHQWQILVALAAVDFPMPGMEVAGDLAF